jgi:hypothetical protein
MNRLAVWMTGTFASRARSKKDTLAMRSGEARGLLFASMNENRKRFRPQARSWLTTTGTTLRLTEPLAPVQSSTPDGSGASAHAAGLPVGPAEAPAVGATVGAADVQPATTSAVARTARRVGRLER